MSESQSQSPSPNQGQGPAENQAQSQVQSQSQAQGQSQPRRRKMHRRSRNGCVTCKQRHIRCDERKPVCTNCLVRGGDCGYANKQRNLQATEGLGFEGGGASSFMLGLAASAAPPPSSSEVFSQMMSAAPADPFDSLPIAMPLKSQELFHHYTSPALETGHGQAPPFDGSLQAMDFVEDPENANNTCVWIAMQDPSFFRSCLLLAAMHYSWINGSLGDVEETYLYHKVEAIRTINEQISSGVTRGRYANSIAALALAESGVGDIQAAETHLNGLFSMVDRRKPDVWEKRLYGLFQRIVLVTGTLIAAARKNGRESDSQEEDDGPSIRHPSFSRGTTQIFNAANFDATKPSPFYFATPPVVEACNADLEGTAVVNSLRRLSSLPLPGCSTEASFASSSGPANTPHDPAISLTKELTQALLLDTEAYLGSLLFKHEPLTSPSPASHNDARPMADEAAALLDAKTGSSPSQPHIHRDIPPYQYPYSSLSPSIAPSSSRAWATAGYLYLHTVLQALWRPRQPIDADLRRWLLDTLRTDVARTEDAMRIGAYSHELWLWKVVVGAYTVAASLSEIIETQTAATAAASSSRSSSLSSSSSSSPGGYYSQVHEDTWAIDPALLTTFGTDVVGGGSASASGCANITGGVSADGVTGEMMHWKDWFAGKIRSWTRAAHVTDWKDAKEVLLRIAWLPAFEGEAIAERMWRDALASDNM